MNQFLVNIYGEKLGRKIEKVKALGPIDRIHVVKYKSGKFVLLFTIKGLDYIWNVEIDTRYEDVRPFDGWKAWEGHIISLFKEGNLEDFDCDCLLRSFRTLTEDQEFARKEMIKYQKFEENWSNIRQNRQNDDASVQNQSDLVAPDNCNKHEFGPKYNFTSKGVGRLIPVTDKDKSYFKKLGY